MKSVSKAVLNRTYVVNHYTCCNYENNQYKQTSFTVINFDLKIGVIVERKTVCAFL